MAKVAEVREAVCGVVEDWKEDALSGGVGAVG